MGFMFIAKPSVLKTQAKWKTPRVGDPLPSTTGLRAAGVGPTKSGRGGSRSAASASAEPSRAGPDLLHPRQWAIFFLPPPAGSTCTGRVACPQRPRFVDRFLRSKAFPPLTRVSPPASPRVQEDYARGRDGASARWHIFSARNFGGGYSSPQSDEYSGEGGQRPGSGTGSDGGGAGSATSSGAG